MKICFLGDAGSVHILRWIEYFRENGHEVHVISFNNCDIDGVNMHFVGDSIEIDSSGGNTSYLKKIFAIRNLIKKIKPDIINAHYLTSYGFIGSLVKGKRKFVVSTWGSDILVTPKKNKIYRMLTEYVIKKSDLLTSDSKYMSQEIYNLGAEKGKVLTVPMGVNINEFKVCDFNEDRENVFLSMRTLCENSNLDVILEAFKIVLEKYSNSRLIVTNSGDKEKEVLGYIKKLDIEDKVEFLGFINRKQMSDILNKGLIFLSIPTSDATSVTLLESMATGTFPIVSNLPANKEWIEDGKNGYVLSKFNSEELSKLMIKALENDKFIKESRFINRNIIEDRAVWENNMKIVQDAYNKLLK